MALPDRGGGVRGLLTAWKRKLGACEFHCDWRVVATPGLLLTSARGLQGHLRDLGGSHGRSCRRSSHSGSKNSRHSSNSRSGSYVVVIIVVGMFARDGMKCIDIPYIVSETKMNRATVRPPTSSRLSPQGVSKARERRICNSSA